MALAKLTGSSYEQVYPDPPHFRSKPKMAKPRTTHRSRGSLITSELSSKAGLSLRGVTSLCFSNFWVVDLNLNRTGGVSAWRPDDRSGRVSAKEGGDLRTIRWRHAPSVDCLSAERALFRGPYTTEFGPELKTVKACACRNEEKLSCALPHENFKQWLGFSFRQASGWRNSMCPSFLEVVEADIGRVGLCPAGEKAAQE